MRRFLWMLMLAPVSWGQEAPFPPEAPAPPVQAAPMRDMLGPAMQVLLPELPSGEIQLSWQDFRQVLGLLYRDALEQQLQHVKVIPPPWAWAVTRAQYLADATQRGTARITASIEIEVLAKGWTKIPVLGDSVGLVQATLNSETVSLTRDKEQLWLLVDAPGRYKLDLEFHVHAPSEKGTASFTFGVQPAPVMHMDLRLLAGDRITGIDGAASWKMEKTGETQVAGIVFRPSEVIKVQWAYPVPPPPEKPVEPPRVAAHAQTWITLRDDHLETRSTLEFQMLRGESNAFRVRLPSGVKILDVSGQGLEWQPVDRGDHQELALNINHAIQESYTCILDLELALEQAQTEMAAPTPVVLDAERQTGHIAVTSVVTADVRAEATGGATRIDASELPETLRGSIPHMILHAFKLTRADGNVVLHIERLEDVAVRVASVEEAWITSIITGQDLVVHRAAYRVRNTIQQFLRIDPGPEAEVWSARVAGRPVKPARDGETSAVLLPMIKADRTEGAAPDFLVEFVYTTPAPTPVGWRHTFEIQAPAVDILTNAVLWEVLLPESRTFWRSEGALEHRPGRAALQRPDRGTLTGVTPQPVFQLREGIERFLITDINNPAASVQAMAKTYSGAQAPPASQVDAQLAGVLPITLTLPEVGHPERFERAYVLQDQALSLVITTHSAGLMRFGRGCIPLGLLGMGALLSLLLARVAIAHSLRGQSAILGILLGITGLICWYLGATYLLWWAWWAAGCVMPLLGRVLLHPEAPFGNRAGAKDLGEHDHAHAETLVD